MSKLPPPAQSNLRVYDRVGPLYDAVIAPVSGRAREQAVAALGLRPEGRLLLAGVGSGLDLPHLPRDARGLGVDLSDGMLRRARARKGELGMPNFELRKMDAQALDLPDESFDAVYLPLIVTVAADGPRVLAEAARVAKPGAPLVVVDKFWPEGRGRPAPVRLASRVLGGLATHIDRRFSEILAGAPHLEVVSDEHLALGGFFRLVVLRKPAR
ncbi:methyltransferase domain-containing protein [Rubrobacter marinus]|uniref:Methyltransferase domain-containing protein n=1 Tax=Rubrobacter marinus TaxID=2653852 RepID=A0A6G8Q1Z5_9ACTN|nr:methyltransferase domain-containing protein [Rubrobacter marinus]QIN80501.1 methyltransferase domain-containing protein [Rubrobacter marinus]